MSNDRKLRGFPALALMFLISLLTPLAARAGVHYQSDTTIETAQGPQKTVVESWIDGDKGRVDFKESSNPIAGKGTYMLTRDGGHTVILVDPEKKAYGEWDIDAMLGSAAAMMGSMGAVLKFEISDPKVETLLDEAGPALLGLPTRHYKYRTTYQMKIKVFGMGRANNVVSEEEMWVTDRLLDKSFGMWLKTGPPKTGNADFDRLIAAEMSKVKGVPLKSVTKTTTSTKGKSQVTTSRTEVTALDNFEKAPVSFEVPAGYEERDMMPQLIPTEGR